MAFVEQCIPTATLTSKKIFLDKAIKYNSYSTDDYGDTIQDDTEKASLFSKCFNRALLPLGRLDYEEIDYLS